MIFSIGDNLIKKSNIYLKYIYINYYFAIVVNKFRYFCFIINLKY